MSNANDKCFEGRVGREIKWLKELEVVCTLNYAGGSIQVWLSGGLADPLAIHQNARIKVYGRMLGNMMKADRAIFYPAAGRFNKAASYRKLKGIK